MLARSTAMQMLHELEARLSNSTFLTGAHRALSDIAIFPFVRQFRGVDAAWFDAQPIPNLQCWLATLLSSRLFLQVMQAQNDHAAIANGVFAD